MSVLERVIERKLTREARRAGFLCLKLNVSGTRGWPDRLLIGPGGLVRFVELKRGRGAALSPIQERVRREIRSRGAEYIRVDTMKKISLALRKYRL